MAATNSNGGKAEEAMMWVVFDVFFAAMFLLWALGIWLIAAPTAPTHPKRQ